MNAGDLPLLLVIDDDPDQLALVRIAALHAGRLRVMAAESGAEALIQLRARAQMGRPPPDAILTDLKMPEMNGIELLQRIRSEPDLHDVPVIVLTSSVYNRDRLVAHLAGASAFVPKPIRFHDLVAFLESVPNFLPSRAAHPADPPAVSHPLGSSM